MRFDRKRYQNRTEPRLLAWLCMWESGNRCFRFVSWLIFSNLAFQTILIQYLMSDKTNPQIQILTIIQIKSKSAIFDHFQASCNKPFQKLELVVIDQFRPKMKKLKDIDLESRFHFLW